MGAGKHTVSIAGNGKTFSSELTVKSIVVIADPANYISTYITELNQDAADDFTELDRRVTEGTMRKSAADSIKKFTQDSHAGIQDMFNQLSEEDKKIYVQMIAANKFWLDEYLETVKNYPLGARSSGSDCEQLHKQAEYANNDGEYDKANDYMRQYNDCVYQNSVARQNSSNRFMKRLETAKQEADQETSKKAFVKTFLKSAAKGLIEEAFGIQDLSDVFGLKSFEDAKQKAGTLVFEDGKEYSLSAGVMTVNLNRQDQDAFPEFKDFISGVDSYNETLQEFTEFLPYVPTKEVPAPVSEKRYYADYTIDQISDSRISIQTLPGGRGKKVKVTCTGTVDGPVNFTMRMKMTSPHGNVEKTFECEYQPDIASILEGGSAWKITYLNVDGADQFKKIATGNKICDNQTYYDSTQMVSGNMSFTRTGTGSMVLYYNEYRNTFSESGGNCTHTGGGWSMNPETTPINWTLDKTTMMMKIPELVDDGVDEYKVTLANGVLTLKSIYIEIRMTPK
jgi:hypothetical protein